MDCHLYLSLMPEALVASMLPPDGFASYYALGGHGKALGQALFIEIDPGFRSSFLPVEKGIARCVPHADGRPKSSVYISVYRVLEHIPVSAMGDMYLVTRDGRALRLPRTPASGDDNAFHFYQELAPSRPAVVSTLGPVGYFDFLMGRMGGFQGLPAIAFVELRLGELASDPELGSIQDLPYENIEHLRMCLSDLKTKEVSSKIFDRSSSGLFPYRVVKNGIFVGSENEGLFVYAMPSAVELKEKHYPWWRSANL